MRTKSNPIVTISDSRSREKDTMSLERLSTSFCSVSSADWPCCLMWTLIPWLLRKVWMLSSSRLAWRTISGTLCSNRVIWLVTGLASRTPMPARIANVPRYTRKIARPRGRNVCRSRTTGATISATVAATMRMSSTEPEARASAHRPRIPSGRSTICTQRGTTTGGAGCGVGASRGWRPGLIAGVGLLVHRAAGLHGVGVGLPLRRSRGLSARSGPSTHTVIMRVAGVNL